jgi:PAS domain S-box-containing protein/putative nucleotidyltransferase with HDIG domain
LELRADETARKYGNVALFTGVSWGVMEMMDEGMIKDPQIQEGRKAEAGAFSAVEAGIDYGPSKEGLGDGEDLLRLILGLSTNFIILPPEEVDDGIDDVLKAIGTFAGVDRSCVFQFPADGNNMISTHEWCAKGIKTRVQKNRGIPVNNLPWFYEKIKGCEVVHVPVVTELPSEAAAEKEQFLREGIQSLIAVPVMAGYSVMGFIGFESVRSKKIWTENIIALLKIVGELFSFALSRKEVTEALRDSESKYKALYEYANDAIFLIKGEQFVECNTKTSNMFGCAKEEILGHNPLEFLPPCQPNGKNSTEEVHEKGSLALSGKPQFFEWKHRRHDGTLFDAEVSFNRVDVGDEIFLQAIVRDITDRKLAEKKLEGTLEDLRKAMGATIQAITHVVETRDPYTAGHQKRVADLARTIATEMNLPHNRIEGIRMAGVIHDIGKISVPAEILAKPGKLTKKEFELIKDHPQTGYDILRDVEFPWPIATIILQHHEKIDGSGYPQGLKGEEICLEARILAVADVVEAIASHRPYRPAHGIDAALEEVEKNKGILYDAEVVEACLRLVREKQFAFE